MTSEIVLNHFNMATLARLDSLGQNRFGSLIVKEPKRFAVLFHFLLLF